VVYYQKVVVVVVADWEGKEPLFLHLVGDIVD
jgi:hypothetical protein